MLETRIKCVLWYFSYFRQKWHMYQQKSDTCGRSGTTHYTNSKARLRIKLKRHRRRQRHWKSPERRHRQRVVVRCERRTPPPLPSSPKTGTVSSMLFFELVHKLWHAHAWRGLFFRSKYTSHTLSSRSIFSRIWTRHAVFCRLLVYLSPALRSKLSLVYPSHHPPLVVTHSVIYERALI